MRTSATQTRKPRVRISDDEPVKANGHDKEAKAVFKVAESLLTKYRPECFREIMGQNDAIYATKSTLDAGVRVIVFYGPSGTGKTTMALCAALEHLGATMDDIVPIDGARYNTVEAMNTVADMFERPPMLGNIRILIIDECQRITRDGWTILLNSLENVPSWLYVFFCTTEIDRVPDNIKSQRATAIPLQLVGTDDILDYLDIIVEYEGWKTPKEVVALCAQQALGSPRRGLSHLSKVTHCKTRDEAARIINVPVAAKELSQDDLGYRLAQMLVTPKWRDIRLLMRRIKETKENVEGIRLVIRAYFSTVIDNDDDEHAVCYALGILDNFDEPLPDYTYLQQAVGRVVFGGRIDG